MLWACRTASFTAPSHHIVTCPRVCRSLLEKPPLSFPWQTFSKNAPAQAKTWQRGRAICGSSLLTWSQDVNSDRKHRSSACLKRLSGSWFGQYVKRSFHRSVYIEMCPFVHSNFCHESSWLNYLSPYDKVLLLESCLILPPEADRGSSGKQTLCWFSNLMLCRGCSPWSSSGILPGSTRLFTVQWTSAGWARGWPVHTGVSFFGFLSVGSWAKTWGVLQLNRGCVRNHVGLSLDEALTSCELIVPVPFV